MDGYDSTTSIPNVSNSGVFIKGIGWRTDERVADVKSTSEDVAADRAQPARLVAEGVKVVLLLDFLTAMKDIRSSRVVPRSSCWSFVQPLVFHHISANNLVIRLLNESRSSCSIFFLESWPADSSI